MIHKQSTILAILLPLVMALAGVAAGLTLRAQTGDRSQLEEIPQPATWTAFAADLTVQHQGNHFTYGRFFRATDGSRRLETWGEGDTTARIISIKNIPTRTHYAFTPNGWSAAPMDVDPSNYSPPRRRVNPRLVKYDGRLALRAGEDGALDAPDGFEAYQAADSKGNMTLFVPELNFWPVVKTSLSSGQRTIYHSIVLGEPSADLFLPPPGVDMKYLTEPRGIVSRVVPK